MASGASAHPVVATRRELEPLARAVFNAFFWPYLLASCVAYFFPALAIFVVTAPFDRRRVVLRAYTNWWAAHYLAWAPFAGCVVEGREHVPVGACVFVSNHQSMVDILAVSAARLRYVWVSKVENFWVPFLGWNMLLCGDIWLKRGYLPSIRRMVWRCDAKLRDGYSLFVFPEGTRSPDGTVQPFYRGAFWVAARNRVPVVPILLEGTDHVLPKRSFSIHPQRCLIRVLEPMDPADYDHDDRRFRDAVRARLLAEQRRVRGESPDQHPDDLGS